MGISLVPKEFSISKMASLVEQAWRAKRNKNSKGPEAISPEKKLQAVPNAKEKPTYSPLLSRRLHKIVSLTIEIPPREPFPPPLVWNPYPRPPPRPPGRLHARRPFARPPARPHPYKRPQSSPFMQVISMGRSLDM